MKQNDSQSWNKMTHKDETKCPTKMKQNDPQRWHKMTHKMTHKDDTKWPKKVDVSVNKNSNKQKTIVSSPEHEVCKVSYCDQSMSVVHWLITMCLSVMRHLSCVVHCALSTVCFKSLLLPHQLTNRLETR